MGKDSVLERMRLRVSDKVPLPPLFSLESETRLFREVERRTFLFNLFQNPGDWVGEEDMASLRGGARGGPLLEDGRGMGMGFVFIAQAGLGPPIVSLRKTGLFSDASLST